MQTGNFYNALMVPLIRQSTHQIVILIVSTISDYFCQYGKSSQMLHLLLLSSLGRFRIIAFTEGLSYLLLGFTMILKYQYGMPKPNYVVGMAHGVLFIVYVLLLLQVGMKYKWTTMQMLWGFLASLVPFGTFYADFKWFRNVT